MKCYNHRDSEAVAICVHCGRAICLSCANPSASGRFVCSSACATSSGQIEDFLATARNKSVQNVHMTAWSMIGMGVIFAGSGVFLQQELRSFPLTVFVGATAIGLIIGGLCYLWIAQRKL